MLRLSNILGGAVEGLGHKSQPFFVAWTGPSSLDAGASDGSISGGRYCGGGIRGCAWCLVANFPLPCLTRRFSNRANARGG